MKTKEEWAKEIDKLLNDKVGAAVEQYQTQREQGLAELVELSALIEGLDGERSQLLERRATLNPLRAADLKEINLQASRVQKINKLQRSAEKKVEALVSQLTDVAEIEPKFMNFLSAVDYTSKPSYADLVKKERALKEKKADLQAECSALVCEPVKNAS
jgi:DNA repair exonuclease SbcCD ATPase subunit